MPTCGILKSSLSQPWRSHPDEWGFPAPLHTPQTRVPELRSRQHFWLKNQWRFGWVRLGAFGVPGIPLKGPAPGPGDKTRSLWASLIEKYQGHLGRNWIVWLQDEGWRGSFQPSRSHRSHAPLLIPPTSVQMGAISEFQSTCLTLFPLPWFFSETSPTQLVGPLKPLPVAFHKDSLCWLILWLSWNLSEVQNPLTSCIFALTCPISVAKQPQKQ